jgi:hypothetical protein
LGKNIIPATLSENVVAPATEMVSNGFKMALKKSSLQMRDGDDPESDRPIYLERINTLPSIDHAVDTYRSLTVRCENHFTMGDNVTVISHYFCYLLFAVCRTVVACYGSYFLLLFMGRGRYCWNCQLRSFCKLWVQSGEWNHSLAHDLCATFDIG